MSCKDVARSEMDALEYYLIAHDFHYIRKPRYESDKFILFSDYDIGEQIVVYDSCGKRKWDVIYGTGSYGYDYGLLEGMGDIFTNNDDSVLGYLTAKDIIDLIEKKRSD